MTTAADHLREALDVGCTRDDHDHVADHRAEVLREGAQQVRAACPSERGRCGCHTAASLLDLLATGRVLHCAPGRTGVTVQETGHQMMHAPAPLLSESERLFLTFALDMAEDAMSANAPDWTDGDRAALKSLRALAADPPVAPGSDPWQAIALSCGEGLDDENIADCCSDKCAALAASLAAEDGARRAERRRVIDGIQMYTPPTHYTDAAGRPLCVHQVPVRAGSCSACWDLADDAAPATEDGAR